MQEPAMQHQVFASADCIIIKVGSSLLVDPVNAAVSATWLSALSDDIAWLMQRGKQVVVVTSGSVAIGQKQLGMVGQSLSLSEKQASAACGQVGLMQCYQHSLGRHDIHCAQILLSLDDSENRRRYLNTRHTIQTLLQKGIVPIINENDTVGTEELRVGDNDRLAARVAQMVSADLLVLLSDVDGLYTANPQTHSDAVHIPLVESLDDAILAMAGGVSSSVGTGGMVTKLAAAQMVSDSGCQMIIARGEAYHAIKALANNTQRHTLFQSQETPQSARKRWIAHSLMTHGVITIDNGAWNALLGRNSLLPVGVTRVEGQFDRGDALVIQNLEGVEVARGLAGFGSEQAQQVIGMNSAEIDAALPFLGRSELVHRNDLTLVEE